MPRIKLSIVVAVLVLVLVYGHASAEEPATTAAMVEAALAPLTRNISGSHLCGTEDTTSQRGLSRWLSMNPEQRLNAIDESVAIKTELRVLAGDLDHLKTISGYDALGHSLSLQKVTSDIQGLLQATAKCLPKSASTSKLVAIVPHLGEEIKSADNHVQAQREAVKNEEKQCKNGLKIGIAADHVPPECKAYPVNSLITGNGRKEQWHYRAGYLYFDNGVLTAIQQTNP